MTPYYDEDGITLYCGDCREILPTFPDKSFDLCLTDPPYGIGKESWDGAFPLWVFPEMFRLSNSVCVIPGIWAVGKCIGAMGEYFRWVVAGYKPDGLTNGKIGINKWQPAVLGGDIGRIGADAFQFSQRDGGTNGHPCQKPMGYVAWLVSKLTQPDQSIVDPFCGSGTTLVAAKQLGRRAVGIEISEKYCEIAVKRLAQMELFR